MIDQETVQRIFDAADILDVVSGFVNLKKRGANYVGLCPFHNEKTGSFNVSPARGIYKCFGCGKGGNAVNFIMEHEQLSYADALRYLAARYNIPVEEQALSEEQRRERGERESMLLVTAYAAEFFSGQLHGTDEGRNVALEYLRVRGIAPAMIEKFGLGYCPEARDALTASAMARGYKAEYLVKTGVCVEPERGVLDRFRGRVMFPVRDIAGKVIAFGGRTMSSDKKVAKYVNSPESEIYHKGRTLYGIYLAKRSVVQQDRCILVEGYTDVISLHAKGVENVVASSGTSLTVEQIRLIRRLTSNVTIIYDGDAAGIKASLRGIDLVLEEGLNARVLLLPEGEDPDSFARGRSSSELSEFIAANETDFISFKTKLLLKEAGSDPIERARLITDIVRSIAKIPDAITRSVYARETAARLEVEERVLHVEIVKLRQGRPGFEPAVRRQGVAPTVAVTTAGALSPCDLEERVLIRYLLLFGTLELYEEEAAEGAAGRPVSVGEFVIRELAEDELTLLNPVYNAIREEYGARHLSPGFIPARHFIAYPDERVSAVVADILSEPYELSRLWTRLESFVESEQMKLAEFLPKVIDNYKMRRVEMLTREADGRILELQEGGESAEIMEWIRRKQAIDRIRGRLSLKLGRTGVK
ncbi:MAG: DNA primase [Odoribacteraceae bacterium]|jgi:DNA primase|nr:DNA primase [Odoribacteraceae bacterium]